MKRHLISAALRSKLAKAARRGRGESAFIARRSQKASELQKRIDMVVANALQMEYTFGSMDVMNRYHRVAGARLKAHQVG